MTQLQNYSFATLQDHIGQEFTSKDGILVDQQRITAFADTTNDHQWIHLDVVKAKAETPFGGTIAHGFLSLSLVAGAMGDSGVVPPDVAIVFNYGIENMRFLAPVPAGSTLRARFTLDKVVEKSPSRKLLTVSCTVDIDGSDKPALIGSFLILVEITP